MMYENVVVQLLLDVFFFISIRNLNFFLRMNRKPKNYQRSVSLKIIFIYGVCACTHVPCACKCPWRPEEGVRFLGTWTTGNCYSWDVSAGKSNNSSYQAASPRLGLIFSSINHKNLVRNVHLEIKWSAIHCSSIFRTEPDPVCVPSCFAL